jgi:ATP-dependent Clp protease ATP-binding subunit ClpC
MFDRFTELGVKCIMLAQQESLLAGQDVVGSEHLFLAILAEGTSISFRILDRLGLTVQEARQQVYKLSGLFSRTPSGEMPFTVAAKRVLEASVTQARDFGDAYISTEHLLLALMTEREGIPLQILKLANINIESLQREIIIEMGSQSMDLEELIDRNTNGYYDYDLSSGLEDYTTNLTTYARENRLDPVIGRQIQIDRVIQILVRRRKNNALLIGEPGVGKTSVVEGLALRIAEGDITEALREKEILALELSSLLAGTKYRGEFEDRLKRIIDEVKDAKNIILLIDEIHMLMGAGGSEGSNDAAQLLKPALARGEFQCIGATTNDEYKKHIQKDAALERRFQVVQVPEPSIDDTVVILYGLRYRYEQHHMIKISNEALLSAAQLSSQFIADRYLPDKAIDLIDESCASLRVFNNIAPTMVQSLLDHLKILVYHKDEAVRKQNFAEAGLLHEREVETRESMQALVTLDKNNLKDRELFKLTLEPKNIATLVALWSGVPVDKVSDEESIQLRNLEETLHTRVIGQQVAVKAISKAVRRSRVGLKSPNRPIASFIFAGPTGVGKTELAKALASFVFGSEKSMIRLDMSEYMERFNISKLIGPPPGYVGYSEGGILTEQVRQKPYTLVLFDEIEKAHLDIFNILLQILEDGRLTDSQARVIDFKNTLIILTSNIGAKAIEKIQKEEVVRKYPRIYEDEDDKTPTYIKMSTAVNDELKQNFRPEFLNRLDEIIIFQQLTQTDVRKIADIMIQQVIKRVFENSQITLRVEDNVKDKLSIEGFDPMYGARPLRRAIMNLFEDELTNLFLEKKFIPGTIIKAILTSSDKIIFIEDGWEEVKESREDIMEKYLKSNLVNPESKENLEKIKNIEKAKVQLHF